MFILKYNLFFLYFLIIFLNKKMQTSQKIFLFKNMLNKNFYKNKICNFGDWTSNGWTGEATTRHVRMNFGNINSYSVFNRNPANVRGRVVRHNHGTKDSTKDFPNVTKQIAALTGQNKQF
jgi:hypothetical protein